MYISKYILNDSNSFVKASLADVDKMHKFVWSFFEDTSDFCVSREGLGILYRVLYKGDKIFLVIQSQMKPNFSIKESYGKEIYSVTDEVMQEKLKKLSTVNFNILVNPTRRDENGKRKYISKVSDRYNWLKIQGEYNGFEILHVDEIESDFTVGVKGKHNITFGVSEMVGTLKITDFEKFYACVCKGLGREKAYGLGLFQFGV